MITVLATWAVLASSQQAWSPERVAAFVRSGRFSEAEVKSLAAWFGGPDKLKAGADARFEGLDVAWAISTAAGRHQVVVRSVTTGTAFEFELRAVGDSGLYVGAQTLHERDGFSWQYVVDGQAVGGPHDLEVYTMPPESKPDPSIPAGRLEQQPQLTSQVFGGSKHDWWVYTPANMDPTKESNLVVFQDGQWSRGYAPVYFDHLIAKGELPQTVVVFVTPGTFPDGKSDRSREYDTLNDSYVRFLLEELLPPVEAKYKITQDPMRRCVAGLSSGGICSFTCAWQRPDKFGLVMSWIGSFTNIASGESLREGGHNYPALIRKTPKKPIRVFLQDGANDLDNVHGNWPLANREMAKALEFSKYDLMTVWGNGFHSDKQGRATMADALRWLFKG